MRKRIGHEFEFLPLTFLTKINKLTFVDKKKNWIGWLPSEWSREAAWKEVEDRERERSNESLRVAMTNGLSKYLQRVFIISSTLWLGASHNNNASSSVCNRQLSFLPKFYETNKWTVSEPNIWRFILWMILPKLLDCEDICLDSWEWVNNLTF